MKQDRYADYGYDDFLVQIGRIRGRFMAWQTRGTRNKNSLTRFVNELNVLFSAVRESAIEDSNGQKGKLYKEMIGVYQIALACHVSLQQLSLRFP